MRKIAIITARGGSKRIPRKNIKEFCGKPIIAYSIEAAKDAGVFDEIMVSTDDEEIAQTARAFGARVPFFRSEENSGDYASTDDVIMEVLTAYRSAGQEFDAFCCIIHRSLLTGERLRRAMELLDTADSVMPVTAFSALDIYFRSICKHFLPCPLLILTNAATLCEPAYCNKRCHTSQVTLSQQMLSHSQDRLLQQTLPYLTIQLIVTKGLQTKYV